MTNCDYPFMRSFVVGASVVSIKYKDGIIMASDTQGSYGHLAKYNDITKIFKLPNTTIISVSGDLADMQFLIREINAKIQNQEGELSALGIHSLVWDILYSARSKAKPLNLFVSVGGMESSRSDETAVDENMRMLGAVDHLGGFYYSDVMSSGLGSYIALPFLRERVEGRVNDISLEEGVAIVEEAMRILCYRNLRSSNKIVVGYVDDKHVSISEPYSITTNWESGKLPEEVVID